MSWKRTAWVLPPSRRRLLLTCPAAVLLLSLLLIVSPVRAECHEIEVRAWSPTGLAGCTVYGRGMASWYAGPGVARNDCLWPWQSCQAIRITSLVTGRTITRQPSMFCDCYTGTAAERVIDLDPSALRQLGLWGMRDRGLFPVEVVPVGVRSHHSSERLPDTAIQEVRQ